MHSAIHIDKKNVQIKNISIINVIIEDLSSTFTMEINALYLVAWLNEFTFKNNVIRNLKSTQKLFGMTLLGYDKTRVLSNVNILNNVFADFEYIGVVIANFVHALYLHFNIHNTIIQ